MSRKIDQLKHEFKDLASKDAYSVTLDDGKTLELDVRVPDLSPFLVASEQGEMSEELFNRITESLRKILQRSYLPHYDYEKDLPKESDENEEANKLIEKLLLTYIDELMVKVMQVAGLIEEDVDVDELREEGAKNLGK